VEDQKEEEALHEASMKHNGVKNQPNEWEQIVQTESDEVELKKLCPKADGGSPLATQRVVSNSAVKSNLVQGHISPAKPALVTIFEEDEIDLEVRNELAGDYWEGGDHKATLEEEACFFDDDPSPSRCVDLQTVKEGVVEIPTEHTLGGEQEVCFKRMCLKDGEEVTKVEKPSSVENFSKPEHSEDKHLEKLQDSDELGECGDNAVSHYQTANCTLPDEVLSGLRGLDGAILLLQNARLDLLRQVGFPETAGVNSAKGGSKNYVGKCYQPGCLRIAANKCRGCLQVQYCSKQCQELAWGQHHKEECFQLGLCMRSDEKSTCHPVNCQQCAQFEHELI